jgi:hypothetical protein
MKITDRINKVASVKESYWNGGNNQLTVYYDPTTTGINELKVSVVNCLGELYWDGAVEKVNFISL